jgi:hypothetical protein
VPFQGITDGDYNLALNFDKAAPNCHIKEQAAFLS